jgi:RNA polymerase sigma factor (sigma-70 family)
MLTAGLGNVLDRLRTAASLQDTLCLTDGQLLERYVAGRDEVAFEALVRRHGQMVLAVCRRILTDPCDAEDAFQATFLVLVSKARSVLPRENVANWLYGVAYRAAQKARVASVRRRSREKQVETMPEPATVAEGLWQDLVPILDLELSRLPEKYRLPIVLCDLEGRTRTEAAHQLGWPECTVAGRLARGRSLLARRIRRHALPLSGGVLAALLAQHAAGACVPVALVDCVGKTAAALASGTARALGIVSANVANLTKGVVRSMFWSKLKFVAAATLLTTVTLGFAGALMHVAWAEGSTELAEVAGSEQGKVDKQEPPQAPDAVAKELKALQGVWEVVGLETDSRKASADDVKGMRWTVKGTRVACTNPGEKSSEGCEIKIDPSKNPKHIDLLIKEGPLKGKTLPGIYKLDQGRLIICVRDDKALEKGRPTEFTAEAGSEQGLITLEPLDTAAKPPRKPAAKPGKAQGDVMQDLRWIVKSPDTLELVGPGGAVGVPVKLPRYQLQAGQELAFQGRGEIVDRGSKLGYRTEARMWVVCANKEGGWRLILRFTTLFPRGTQGNPEKQIVRFAWFDLYPDGRIVGNECPGSLMLVPREVLPRLPGDAHAAARGWTGDSEQGEPTYRYRLLPASNPGHVELQIVGESALDAAAGLAIKSNLTFDCDRGLPEKLQFELTYEDNRSERGTVKLGEIETHTPEWCRAFAADAERYFAARDAYQRALARQDARAHEFNEILEKALADLKAARRTLEQPEFRAQIDKLVAEHEWQAKAVVEAAEQRWSVLGKPAADWSTTDLEGRPHALKDYRGKVVILDFWYRSCSWCVRSMPQVNEIAAHFVDKPVVVLGMNTDSKEEDGRAVVVKMRLNYANLKAIGLPQKYKVQVFPTLVIIDQQGVVRDIHAGYSPTLKEDVVKSVDKLLNRKP